MSNRKTLVRAIAARTKPRFIEIPRERGGKVCATHRGVCPIVLDARAGSERTAREGAAIGCGALARA